MSLVWDTPPSALVERAGDWARLMQTNVGTEVANVALEAQTTMKTNRPWKDISGNARRGLRTAVESTPEQMIMYFIHSVEYGVYLELARGGKHAIIMPTMQGTLPILRQRLTGIAD